MYDSIQDFIDIFFSKSDFEGSRKRSALLQNKGGDYRLKYDFFFVLYQKGLLLSARQDNYFGLLYLMFFFLSSFLDNYFFRGK